MVSDVVCHGSRTIIRASSVTTGSTTYCDNGSNNITAGTGDWIIANDSASTAVWDGGNWTRNTDDWIIRNGISQLKQLAEDFSEPKRIGGIYVIERRRRNALEHVKGSEAKARQLLLRLIGPARFRRYLRDGFVSHRGRSGKIYQIRRGQDFTSVWVRGELLEKLCLVFADYKLPPTDLVVMRLLMLEHSEEEFRAQANVWTPNGHRLAEAA